MKQTPHLSATITSVLVLVIALVGFDFYAQHLERQYVNALAPLNLAQARNGIALQQAAFQQPDLLPVYGSSEITEIDTPYQANHVFETYPTGFMVFDIANLGASSISIAQNLAALGPDLRGKKFVISFSTADFTMGSLPVSYYAGNYSRMHAYEMIFNPYLSMPLKISAAKRMLEFPSTLQDDPFLEFNSG